MKNFDICNAIFHQYAVIWCPSAAAWVEISFIFIGKIVVKFVEEYNNDDNSDDYNTPDAANIDARDEMFPPGQ